MLCVTMTTVRRFTFQIRNSSAFIRSRVRRVQGAEGLVEEEDGWLVDQRAGERDALLHTAGKLGGMRGGKALQAHERDERLGALRDLLDRRVADLERQGDVCGDRAPRHQVGALEDEANVTAWLGQLFGAELHAARDRAQEAGQQAQERALATAGRADDGEELPLLDGQRQVVEREHVVAIGVVEGHAKVGGVEDGRHLPTAARRIGW